MTPDEDDRMERAERIRKLREHGGGGGSDADDSGGTPATAATGVELPDEEEMEAALEEQADASGSDADGDGEDAGTDGDDAAVAGDDVDAALAAATRGFTSTSAHARVLEFALGDDLYCIDIADVEEIVKRETVTRVPNTPDYVEGVVDLRGQITTILDARGLLEIEQPGPESLVVVFAPDAFEELGAVGWVVDEVRQVRPITDDEVRDAPMDDAYVEGILEAEESDDLVVWVRPDDAIEVAVDGPGQA